MVFDLDLGIKRLPKHRSRPGFFTHHLMPFVKYFHSSMFRISNLICLLLNLKIFLSNSLQCTPLLTYYRAMTALIVLSFLLIKPTLLPWPLEAKCQHSYCFFSVMPVVNQFCPYACLEALMLFFLIVLDIPWLFWSSLHYKSMFSSLQEHAQQAYKTFTPAIFFFGGVSKLWLPVCCWSM